MKCTNCNAPVTPEEEQAGCCKFCGATLSRAPAPSAGSDPFAAIDNLSTLTTVDAATSPGPKIFNILIFSAIGMFLILLPVGALAESCGMYAKWKQWERARHDRDLMQYGVPAKAQVLDYRAVSCESRDCFGSEVSLRVETVRAGSFDAKVVVFDPAPMNKVLSALHGKPIDVKYDLQSHDVLILP